MVRYITIHRKGYYRKAYIRADGTKVKRTWVPPSTYKIVDRGSPGKTSRGAKGGKYAGKKKWITREGKLGGAGYMSKPAATRHALLNRCVREYGYRSCLGSLMVLNRSKAEHTKYGKIINADKNYLKNKFGGKGSFGPRKKTTKRKR